MPAVSEIQSLEQIKLLADPRRLAILQRLMAAPATLTQLGHALDEHPAWVRHHLKQLEEAGLVELVDERVTGGYVEKYYQAGARAYLFHTVILPQASDRPLLALLGSHDLGLQLLSKQFPAQAGFELLVVPVGSLDGLVALRQGLTALTACHLLDPASGEYNRPYVQHFFPDRTVHLVTLAQRHQGLILAAGNPSGIRTLADLARPRLRFINRNPGSGTRLWLEQALAKIGLGVADLHGEIPDAATHTAVAQAVLQGKADAGIGLEAAARQAGLDFVPLFSERFDLVIPDDQLHTPALQALLNYLNSRDYRQRLQALAGYSTSQTGAQISP